MKILAHAKINPSLLITGKRSDGYHDLKLVFLMLELADELTAEPNGDGIFRLTCSEPSIPIEDNLITKAWQMVRADYPQVCGLDVSLVKKIPSGAGLGGGSADAAAFLTLLNRLFDLGLSAEGLAAYGVRLGADVPALLLGCASLGTGIGERLHPLQNSLRSPVLIVKPGFSCSTKDMYGRFDRTPGLVQSDNTAELVRALACGDLTGVCKNLFNVFEQLLDPPQAAVIGEIRRRLTGCGASGALMTGSGSCVFGLFGSEEERDAAAAALSDTWQTISTVIL